MARPIKVRGATVRRLLARLAALGLATIVVAGCSFTGRVVTPTIQPRLLDPTVSAGPVDLPVATTLPALAPAPVAPSVQIIGVVEAIDGAIWVVDGVRVRIQPAVVVAPGLGPGSLVRITARLGEDDDTLGAVRVDVVAQATVVGQITLIEATRIVVDGRVIVIPPGFVLPDGLVPGVIVRVVVDDEGGTLLPRQITLLPEATIIGGMIEIIAGDIIVIGGQRLRLAPDVMLWRVRPIVGEPVRIIVVPINGVLTVIVITIVTIVVPPPVVVLPVPTVVVVPPPIVNPAPRPAPRPPPSNDGGRSDDDDDDDDD